MDLLSKVKWRYANYYLDWPDIRQAILKLDHYAENYDWAVGKDLDKACTSISDAIVLGNVLIVDGYMVCVAIITPWYSNEEVLQEWLVLKIADGGSIKSVPLALEEVAMGLGIKLIMSADSSPVNIVAGAYKEAAFKPLTTSFYKVI